MQETLKLAVAAIEQGAQLYELKGELYAALAANGKYTVWKLVPGSPEYYVTRDSCTCPARHKPCKHMEVAK